MTQQAQRQGGNVRDAKPRKDSQIPKYVNIPFALIHDAVYIQVDFYLELICSKDE